MKLFCGFHFINPRFTYYSNRVKELHLEAQAVEKTIEAGETQQRMRVETLQAKVAEQVP